MRMPKLPPLIRSLLLLAALWCPLACGGRPCPDGVHNGSLIVKDDEYFVSQGAFGGLFSYGKLGEAGVEECREIFGSLIFEENVSSFADFDNLEIVAGNLAVRNGGYPRDIVDGRERNVVDGFESLLHVGGNVSGGVFRGMSSLETVGGGFLSNATSLFSLREVGGDLRGPGGPFGLSHLESLERVGRDFSSASGDLDGLRNLVSIGRDVSVSYAEDVRFVLPALESIGRNVSVRNNDGIGDIAVPSLAIIGGSLRFRGNRSRGITGVSERARAAFANVAIGEIILICANGPGDPCPDHDDCLDYYDEEDGYCCPLEMSVSECIDSQTREG